MVTAEAEPASNLAERNFRRNFSGNFWVCGFYGFGGFCWLADVYLTGRSS
jgi:hypothetical protein